MERDLAPGKRGGAASIGDGRAALIKDQTSERVEAVDERVEAVEESLGLPPEEVANVPPVVEELISPETLVYTAAPNTDIFDLYEVGHKGIMRTLCKDKSLEIPFAHQIKLHGPQGEIVCVSALFNGAAMVAAMCTSLFKLVKHRLGHWLPSQKKLRMANGMIVPSQARWEGTIQLRDVVIRGSFEVFDSGGSWAFLLGKPLLRLFKAKQNFGLDTVEIEVEDGSVSILKNELNIPKAVESEHEGVNLALDIKQLCYTSKDLPVANHALTTAQPVYVTTTDEADVLTRDTHPLKPERVARILQEVTIRSDVTKSQHDEVRMLISKYADCFALAIKEVNAIPNAVHKLNIPEGATFRTKILPRSYNPDQRAFMEAKIDEMLEAGIIQPIHPRDVQFVAQTVLAQKTHDGEGVPLDELKHKVNDQCTQHGLPGEFDMPPQPEPPINLPSGSGGSGKKPTKWRMCQDFNGINRVTEVAPTPQGDLRAKQLRLSGHRFVHVFDFAAGFYGIAVHPDSQPYITFYVEGRGYFAYQRMPFGVTGGPSEFGHVTAQRFHDLIAKMVLELFVDDGGMGADTFKEGMEKLEKLLERVRREKMSLSPSKLQLFMTEAVFAGALVQRCNPRYYQAHSDCRLANTSRCVPPRGFPGPDQLLP